MLPRSPSLGSNSALLMLPESNLLDTIIPLKSYSVYWGVILIISSIDLLLIRHTIGGGFGFSAFS